MILIVKKESDSNNKSPCWRTQMIGSDVKY